MTNAKSFPHSTWQIVENYSLQREIYSNFMENPKSFPQKIPPNPKIRGYMLKSFIYEPQ